jgi:hypothetical protein
MGTGLRAAGLMIALGALGLLSCATGTRPRPRPLPQGTTFEGTWDSTWGKMVLSQEGTKVSGTFTGYREGALSGTIDGDVFSFIWDQRVPRQHGHGYMQLSPDGLHLEGRWGYLADDTDGGRWAADKDLHAE